MQRKWIVVIRSMTGYGRAQMILHGRDITVELKSVNHKYFELNCRTPHAYGYLEEKIKSLLQSRIGRGKVDCFITVNDAVAAAGAVTLNKELAGRYLAALREVSDEFSLRDDLSLSTLLRFPDVFTVTQAPVDEDEVWADVREVAEQAVEAFIAMREVEGEKLRADVLSRGDRILTLVSQIEARSPEIVSAYRKRLEEKIAEVLEDRSIDESRVLTEAAIFADRIAVDEETVRLRSHIDQLNKMLAGDEAIGRKLDFLVQEMNREANTTGSKNSDLVITNLVVEIKAEIEKIREQIQNIE